MPEYNRKKAMQLYQAILQSDQGRKLAVTPYPKECIIYAVFHQHIISQVFLKKTIMSKEAYKTQRKNCKRKCCISNAHCAQRNDMRSELGKAVLRN